MYIALIHHHHTRRRAAPRRRRPRPSGCGPRTVRSAPRTSIFGAYGFRRPAAAVLGLPEVVELLPDAVGVGVVEVFEDAQRLLVCVAGGLRVASGVLAVAEVAEDRRFVVALAEVAEQGQSALVAGDGVAVVAEVVVGVPQAVPGGVPGRCRARCPARRAFAARSTGCGTGLPGRPARWGCAAVVPGGRPGSRAPRWPGPSPVRWVEAAQVHIELPVGEPVGDPVRPVDGQGGLPGPRIVTQ